MIESQEVTPPYEKELNVWFRLVVGNTVETGSECGCYCLFVLVRLMECIVIRGRKVRALIDLKGRLSGLLTHLFSLLSACSL